MNSNKMRSSNMELLRILAMVMVIIYHLTYHCVNGQLNDLSFMGANAFRTPSFFGKLFLIESVQSFGMIANSVFIIISGYFLVEKDKEINLGGISKKLLLQIGFIAIVMVFLPTIYYRLAVPSADATVKAMSITEFNNMNWFVGYYYIIVVCAGLFINEFLGKLDKQRYRNMLLVCLGLFSFTWSGKLLDGISDGIRTVLCGMFLFALGGYIKKYNPFERIRTGALIAIIIVIYGLIYMSYYNVVCNAIHEYIKQGSVDGFSQPLFGFENYGIIPVIISTVLLELFRRVNIPNSRVINYLGASTFMVYLTHDNEFWWNIWQERDWITVLYENPLLYCIHLFKWTVFMFAIGVIAYTIYKGLCKMFMRCKNIVIK